MLLTLCYLAIRRSKPPDQNVRSNQPPPKVTVAPVAPAVNRAPVNTSHSDPYSLGDRDNKKKPQAPQKGGRKLTKADIGLPTDFK